MLAKKTLLIVEDSPEVRAIAEGALGGGYSFLESYTLEGARRILDKADVSLMILDIELPDGNGLEFFSRIRSETRFRSLPVIFLTGKADLTSKLAAFSLGADDFVAKPFEPAELRARVEARLRKIDASTAEEGTFRVEDLTMDVPTQRAWVNRNGELESISLTPIEFRILALLVRQLGRIYDRDTLIDAVWGAEVNVLDRTVDTHVSHIRRKISASQIRLEAVSGEGYRAVKGS